MLKGIRAKRRGSDDGARDADVGDVICAVCLEAATDPATLSRCGGHAHTFCFSCIQQWAEVTNRCPLCKVGRAWQILLAASQDAK